ncbi:DUF2968 domain-containing protein [Stenotrophomonas tumulicola]|uniref:DUF2968 domain-containing protein n=1 Tax=Stenotrophomonas tumulicola TaxID=1685415 RepID=A0A7W3IHQ1_9GAMM|nr:DUF2968 domain-containing protein [Stenotrophomonas tumulicola]MBA8680824.1 DUF2968 domain-containing protein [Stenotrophomonas tumulicola]
MRQNSGEAAPNRRTLAGALALAMILSAPSAFAARADRTPTPDPAQAAPVARSSVDELRQLMDAQQLSELRTTYNGNYGASLLFNPSTLNYYVALFQDKNFWRVIKTDSVENAEHVYRSFVQQTEQLAQVNIDSIRLEAGKRYTERLVAFNEQRLQTLQTQLEQERAQSMQVSTALEQAQQQAVSLSTDLQSSNSQLDSLQQRVQMLQLQQGDPELSLPKPAPAQAPEAPAADTTY